MRTPMAKHSAAKVAREAAALGQVVTAGRQRSLAARERPSAGTVVMSDRDCLPRGGRGGSVEVRGKEGIALGGKGGRGGNVRGAVGGDGDGGIHFGDGISIGGDGGDAGRYGRPTLGAPSTCEHKQATDWSNALLRTSVDEYGILIPGRGGDSGSATIVSEGRVYSLNVLLKLLRIWRNEIIDHVDGLSPETPQEWWDSAKLRFPTECGRALAHMRECEDHPDRSPLSPYP